jgi:ABC-2 type transport system ATP-binding protein
LGGDALNDLVIQTDALTKRYGRVMAVDGLSMEVRRGHVYGLLGPNGSGKTTTMGMLLGLVRPTSGGFSLFGEAGRQEEALRRIGAIVETPSFYPYLSGRQNLAYFQGISGRGSPGEIDELLDRVGLLARADSRFQTYSLGMKQRLGLAYAMLGDPDLLFLDEPTNGMDPEGMIEVRDLIRSLGTGGRTVLLSSHLLHEVEQVCDSVTIISKGKLIAQGEVSELLRSSGSEQVRLRTTDNARATEILAALEWVGDVTTADDSLVASAPHERSADLTAALSRSEVYVAEMGPVGTSLEEFFLEVTGSDERGEE